MHDRIALGTARFGLPYGISNTDGQTSRSECQSILEYASTQGIHMLDTAIAYGESERTLGSIGMDHWQVITKLPELPDDVVDVSSWVDRQLSGALERLQIQSVHGLLLHRPDQLDSPRGPALYAALNEQRGRRKVAKIGISIYSPDELEGLPPAMHFDIVQAPFSVLDRRMVLTGWADRLAQQGTEFHARSIFLQGLLLMSGGTRPRQFERWQTLWNTWETWLQARQVTPLEACLNYALNTSLISKVIVGVNRLPQLREILDSVRDDIPDPPADLMTNDTTLLNPGLWNPT